jgi:hypothetical protein
MGNNTSSNPPQNNKSSTPTSIDDPNSKFDNFDNVMDFIASYYILTLDFQSLKKLYEKDYCDKLVILTSGIIDRYFSDVEITYLAQRIKNGEEVNELSKEKVMFLTKNQFDDLDVKNDKTKSIKKRALCIGISKFYVKIAHIFSAIMMTINPVYIYKDIYGNLIKTSLLQKDKIPPNVPRKLYKMNICDERISALRRGQTNDPYEVAGDITVAPKICNMNFNKNGSLKTLAEEPGIPELKDLYYDDIYDYKTGQFVGMTPTTKKIFMDDLKKFFTVFTGNTNMPDTITKFSDIKLKDYQKTSLCQGPNPYAKNKYVGNVKDKLFADYANNIKIMIQNANAKQDKLLAIINILFTYVIDPFSGKKKIRVNPNLTEELLQKTIEDTRRVIIDLYLSCEMDYNKGIQLFEAIVEQKILDTTQNQIKSLENEAARLVQEVKTKPDI